MKFAIPWMDMKIIMMSKMNQRVKAHRVIKLIYGIQRNIVGK